MRGMSFPKMDRLAAATTQMGLPPLMGIRHLETSGPIDRWGLGFEGPQQDLMLTRILWSPGRDPLHCALAAIKALEAEDLPVPTGMQIFPDGLMDHPTSLVPAPAGVPSKQLVRRAPAAMPHVLAAMGRVVAELSQLYQVRFGVRGDAGQFAPTRATWSDEWRGLAEVQLVGAQAAGLGDLGVCTRLWDALEATIPGLPATVTSTVVHFGLRPASLHFHVSNEGPRLSRIGEWGDALAGDPLAAWAPLLCRMGGTEMAIVLEAFGAEQARAWLDDDSIDRIQVYARTRALSHLRDAAQRARFQPSDDAAKAMERAVALCERALSDTWARDVFEAGLNKTSTGATFPAESNADRIDRRVLLGLAAGPPPMSDRAPYLLAALAAADLGRLTEGPNATHFEGLGDRFIRGANLPSEVLPALPIADRAAWRQTLVSVAAEQCEQAGPGMALALLANGLQVLDRLDDQVSSRSLRGLEAVVLATLAREAPRRSSAGLEARHRIVHGVVGQDAALRLGMDDLAARYNDQVVDALDVLAVATKPPREGDGNPSMEDLLPMLTRPIVYAGERLLALPFAAAVHRLGEQGLLVDQAGSLFQAGFSAG